MPLTSPRAGFTLIELMIVVIVLSILGTIGARSYRHILATTTAVRVTADMRAINMAAYQHQLETGQWPGDAAPGVVPPEISDRLPGIQFRGSGYLIDWENVTEGGSAVVGVAVSTGDRGMEAALISRVRSSGANDQARGRPFMMAGE